MSKPENNKSISKNHEQAPICAAWVKQMRELFGDDVKVLWVREGDFKMGDKPDEAGLHSERR